MIPIQPANITAQSPRRIDIWLVETGAFPSRAKAREAIEAGLVTLNGHVVHKPAENVTASDHVVARAPYPWVSRGGVKLAAALEHFTFDPDGLVCLDAGASTGGFSDVLLTRGAAKIYAVDVGSAQLHPRIAADPRVRVMEQTDIRTLDANALDPRPQLAVCDVSFISLKLVLPAIFNALAPAASLIALIKPQFEAGPARVAKGIVRDEKVRQEVCCAIVECVEAAQWRVKGLIPSPIAGGDGNVEFLIMAQRDE